MPETLDTADEIKKISFKIQAIEATQQLMLRKDAPELTGVIIDLFKKHALLAFIYDALDGVRTQRQVMEYLTGSGHPCSEATVSRRIDVLAEEGLIERVRVGKDGVVWSKKQSVERGLRLTKELRREKLLP